MFPPSNPSDSNFNKSDATPVAQRLVTQWSSSGESRVDESDRRAIDKAIDDTAPGEYRSVFPLHGSFGALNIGVDGFTMWLYTDGGAHIAGELVSTEVARARSVPASGTVNISALPADLQAAVMTLLNAKR